MLLAQIVRSENSLLSGNMWVVRVHYGKVSSSNLVWACDLMHINSMQPSSTQYFYHQCYWHLLFCVFWKPLRRFHSYRWHLAFLLRQRFLLIFFWIRWDWLQESGNPARQTQTSLQGARSLTSTHAANHTAWTCRQRAQEGTFSTEMEPSESASLCLWCCRKVTIITYKLGGKKKKILGNCRLNEQEVLKKDDLRSNGSDR